MHDWERLMNGCTLRLVTDPLPVRVDHLISGRWPETQRGKHDESRAAMLHNAGELIKDMSWSGQRVAIVARYQVGIDIPHPQLWPELMACHENPKEELATRMLVYEGNHRLAVARFLRWQYVMVEPRIWMWTDSVMYPAASRNIEILKRMSRNFGDRAWRREDPRRPDKRPIEPEKKTPVFHGGIIDDLDTKRYDARLWASLRGAPLVQEK
jgi:hypothetical protein